MSCVFSRCKQPISFVYLGKEICDQHWAKLCNAKDKDAENKILAEINLCRGSNGQVMSLRKAEELEKRSELEQDSSQL